MSAKEWAKLASGRNLRWEVVGVILSLVGLIAVNLSNWDSIFDSIREKYVDRGTFTARMRKASEYCACFCYVSEVLNDIYVCFMYEDLILLECVKGDARECLSLINISTQLIVNRLYVMATDRRDD
jgi:hypothetical protein